MKISTRRPRRPGQHRIPERGVALVMVMIFLMLMLLLGLAATMTSITEVNVGGNLRLATEAFNTADAGAAHAFEMTKNMKGDFTCFLRGPDDTLQSGDEFTNYTGVRIFRVNGTVLTSEPTVPMFNTAKVRTLTKVGVRSMYRLDSRHVYELIAYDNAGDDRSWLADAPREILADAANNPLNDGDQRVIIRSIGYVMPTDVPDDLSTYAFDPTTAVSSAVVDVVIGLNPYPAVISNDDLEVTNSITIGGSLGSVHANDDLTLGTGNFTISQTATFSDGAADTPPSGANSTADNSHVAGYNGPQDALFVPDLNPYEYGAKYASYLLITPGAATGSANPRTALVNAFNTFANGSGASLQALFTAYPNKTMIIAVNRSVSPPTLSLVTSSSGNMNNQEFPIGAAAADRFEVTIANNSGVSIGDMPSNGNGKAIFVLMPPGIGQTVSTNANISGQITIITNGSVSMNGNASVRYAVKLATPEQPPWAEISMLALAGEDLVMNGNAAAVDLIEGILYCHEQFDLSGSGNLVGQVVGLEKAFQWNAGTGTYITNTSGTNPGSFSFNPLVDAHRSIVRGNYEVYHNISTGYLGNFAIAAWRQLRDFDPTTAAR